MRWSVVTRAVLAAVAALGFIGALAGPAAAVDADRFMDLGLEAAEGNFDAPDFRLWTVEKEMVSLSEHKGKVVVLNFWTTW